MQDGMAIPAPSRVRMTRHALAVLEAAAAEARDDPIKATPAIRLSLAWLALSGTAELWHVESFWKAMTTRDPSGRGMAEYCRRRDLHLCLSAWKRRAAEA